MIGRVSEFWHLTRQPRYRWLWWLVAAALFGGVRWLAPSWLDPSTTRALAVLTAAAFLWATNALPLAVTGVVVLFLLSFGKGARAELAYRSFGSEAVFFILGAFMLSSPVMRSGLSTRIALAVMTRFGKQKRSLVLSVLVTAALLSLLVSEHVVVAMLLPIVLEVLEAAEARRGGRFALGLLLALAWGAIIGGTGTLLGGRGAPSPWGCWRKWRERRSASGTGSRGTCRTCCSSWGWAGCWRFCW